MAGTANCSRCGLRVPIDDQRVSQRSVAEHPTPRGWVFLALNIPGVYAPQYVHLCPRCIKPEAYADHQNPIRLAGTSKELRERLATYDLRWELEPGFPLVAKLSDPGASVECKVWIDDHRAYWSVKVGAHIEGAGSPDELIGTDSLVGATFELAMNIASAKLLHELDKFEADAAKRLGGEE